LFKNLCQCLLYFKPQGNDQSVRKQLFDATRPIKWGGKDVLTPRIAENLVVRLSTLLNLDELLTFDLLESFFMTNDTTRRTLIYLITIDQNLTNIENQIQQQGSTILQNPQLAS
jgi:hypothetical protein